MSSVSRWAATGIGAAALTFVVACRLLLPPIEEDWIVAVDLAAAIESVQVARADGRLAPLDVAELEEALLEWTHETLSARLGEFGFRHEIVLEPGRPARLRIGLPRIEDQERVRRLIESPGTLAIRPILEVASAGEAVEEGGDWHDGPPGWGGGRLLLAPALATEADLLDARVVSDEFGTPALRFALQRPAAKRLHEHTSASVGQRLAVLLDGSVQTVPVIQGAIAGEGVITGDFDASELADLALRLRTGALPAAVRVEETGRPRTAD